MAAKKQKEGSLKILSEAELRKKYSASARRASYQTTEQLFLPCRSLAINHQLGGGVAYGRVAEFMGYESTGKSLLALDFGYVAQTLGGVLLWNDAEGTWNNNWAELNGIDPSKVELYEDNDIEGFSDWARDMIIYYRSILTKNEPICLVVDSIAAWDCAENIDTDQKDGKAEMGNRAKAIYKMYRKRNKFFKKYGVCVIPINQVREKVGASMFEDSQTTPGGAATKFYASQRIVIGRGKQIKGGPKDRKVGQNVYIQIKKNKIGPPKDTVQSAVYFVDWYKGYVGFDRYKGLSDILVDEGIIKKKGGNYYYKGELVAKSEEKFIGILATNDKLRRNCIRRSSINTASKLRDKLESITTNLFPVKLRSKKDEDGTNE